MRALGSVPSAACERWCLWISRGQLETSPSSSVLTKSITRHRHAKTFIYTVLFNHHSNNQQRRQLQFIEINIPKPHSALDCQVLHLTVCLSDLPSLLIDSFHLLFEGMVMFTFRLESGNSAEHTTSAPTFLPSPLPVIRCCLRGCGSLYLPCCVPCVQQ